MGESGLESCLPMREGKAHLSYAISPSEAAMTTGARQPQKGYRTLRFPLTEHEYDPFLSENAFAQERLAQR